MLQQLYVSKITPTNMAEKGIAIWYMALQMSLSNWVSSRLKEVM